MEEIALGEMAMTEIELYTISPRSLFNKINGYRKREQDNWERTRMQTYLLLLPSVKDGAKLTPQSIMPFPWDVNQANKASVSVDKVRKRSSEMWAKIDAKTK